MKDFWDDNGSVAVFLLKASYKDLNGWDMHRSSKRVYNFLLKYMLWSLDYNFCEEYD
jgi:hypothetical protein